MRKVLVTFITAWVTLFAVLLYLGAPSEANGLLELQQVDITYRSFFPGGVDPLITENPYLPGRNMGKELNLAVNMDLLEYLYWNNTVHSMTDEGNDGSSQFRMVGWEFGLGVDFRRFGLGLPFSVGYYHFSRHTLDIATPNHFPVCDSLELRIYLYERKSR